MICDGGPASSTTEPPSASMSDGNTDCLCELVTQEVGTPEACNHSISADCLQEWLINTNTCPTERQVCDIILVRRCLGGELVRRIHVQEEEEEDENVIDYFMRCEVCGSSNRFHALILCDRCGRGYHLEYLYPPLETVPLDEWICSDCC
jgi:hypothetical protein